MAVKIVLDHLKYTRSWNEKNLKMEKFKKFEERKMQLGDLCNFLYLMIYK